MYKSFYLIILNFFLLGSIPNCQGQSVDKNKFSTIISLNRSYHMDVATTYLHSYGEVYLITSNEPIDSMLLLLSKSQYVSQKGIFDALKSKFNVYTIDKNEKEEDLFDDLVDTKNYKTSYTFMLDERVREPQSITTYTIWQRAATPYKFSKVDKKCNPAKSYCEVTIKKSS